MRVQRIDQIEEYIIENKTATLEDLCEKFNISKNTIRRDINELVKRGNIEKVYGGVTAVEKESGEYAGVASGSYNYANSNPELKERMEKDLEQFLKEHPGVKAEDVPAELLTASGSGLDPHISPESAEVQIPTVAKNSGLSEEEVKKIVEENTEKKTLGVFGEERVNVLGCNLDIAAAMGK